jgi:hypothetical protein
MLCAGVQEARGEESGAPTGDVETEKESVYGEDLWNITTRTTTIPTDLLQQKEVYKNLSTFIIISIIVRNNISHPFSHSPCVILGIGRSAAAM